MRCRISQDHLATLAKPASPSNGATLGMSPLDSGRKEWRQVGQGQCWLVSALQAPGAARRLISVTLRQRCCGPAGRPGLPELPTMRSPAQLGAQGLAGWRWPRRAAVRRRGCHCVRQRVARSGRAAERPVRAQQAGRAAPAGTMAAGATAARPGKMSAPAEGRSRRIGATGPKEPAAVGARTGHQGAPAGHRSEATGWKLFPAAKRVPYCISAFTVQGHQWEWWRRWQK